MSLNSNLEASRYAYLLTAPICMLLGLAVARIPFPRSVNSTARIALSAIFGITFMIGGFGLLKYNNGPWREAGITANAIQAGLLNILGPDRKLVATQRRTGRTSGRVQRLIYLSQCGRLHDAAFEN